MKLVLATLTLFALSACATDDTVEEFDDKLESTSSSNSGEEIGVNDDDQVILRSERSAGDELSLQRATNAFLLDQLESDHFALKRCVRELADPRLNGRGEWPRLPNLETLKEKVASQEKIGMRDEKVKVKKERNFTEELRAERSHEESIRAMQTLVNSQLEECDQELGIARVKVGLPEKRYTAEGYFTQDGTWVETRKGEQSLGDAFEIQAKARHTETNSVTTTVTKSP